MLSWVVFRASALALSAAALPGRVFSSLALRPVIWLVTHRPSTLEQPEACALPLTSVRESMCTPTLPAASSYCTTRPVSSRIGGGTAAAATPISRR